MDCIVIYLDGLDEGEEQDSDADASPEKLDEPGCAEETEEADVDDLGGVDDAPDHRDEVKRVPGVFEVWLEENFGDGNIEHGKRAMHFL